MSELEGHRECYSKGQIRARYMQRNGLLEGETLFYAENGQLI
jgi:antitoxin component YwqK of YwqJK toxin-antitoxin module